jgi:group I intron endonuclease
MSRDYKTGIYKITNSINDKFYIGSSINITNRWKAHIYRLNSGTHANRHLQNAWNQYGMDSFVFERIENVKDKNKLIEREQYYLDTMLYAQECIKENDSRFSELGYNLNPTAGSNLGVKYSEESKKKMGEWERTLEMRERMSNARRGIVFTEEHKKNIGKFRLGKKYEDIFSAEKAKELKDKTSKRFKGKPLTEDHKIKCRKPKSKEHAINISNAKKGIKLSIEHRESLRKSHQKPILQYGIDGVFIREFETAKLAANSLDKKYTGYIIKSCRKLNTIAHGFIWKYKD